MVKNLKVYFLVMLLVLSAMSVPAFAADEKAPVPAKLLEVFDKGFNGVSYVLTETSMVPQTTVATMEVKCKSSSVYRLELVNQAGEKVVSVFNGPDGWIHNVKNNTVEVLPKNPDNDFKSLVTKASKITEGQDGEFVTYALELTGENKIDTLYVDTKENIIARQVIKSANGDVILKTEISNLKREKIDETLFKMPEGAKVINK